mmetsp:Transcript_17378/g.48430  ORF Transcript_17378/g.48430 Transcript_17378/m.48430 type:complete len:277 (+) Transcript_17378:866-1696(+)
MQLHISRVFFNCKPGHKLTCACKEQMAFGVVHAGDMADAGCRINGLNVTLRDQQGLGLRVQYVDHYIHQHTTSNCNSQVGEDRDHCDDDDDESIRALNFVVHGVPLALTKRKARVEHNFEGPPGNHVVDHHPYHANKGSAGDEVYKRVCCHRNYDDHYPNGDVCEPVLSPRSDLKHAVGNHCVPSHAGKQASEYIPQTQAKSLTVGVDTGFRKFVHHLGCHELLDERHQREAHSCRKDNSKCCKVQRRQLVILHPQRTRKRAIHPANVAYRLGRKT